MQTAICKDELLAEIDASLQRARAMRLGEDLPIERVAGTPKTAEEASERWLLAALYYGSANWAEVAETRIEWTVRRHAYLYRVLVVARMIQPSGFLTSTDLEGATEDDLAILRAAVNVFCAEGQLDGMKEHLDRCRRRQHDGN